MPESILSVSNLEKTYGKRLFKKGHKALHGVSLEVGRGSVFGLLGPNGAGKTTLIKILLGLVRSSAGEAELFGQPVGQPAPRKRVGYLPEAHRLPPYLTGHQVLRLFGQLCGRDAAWLDKRIPGWLERVDMTGDAHRKIKEYSKGMCQRIGIAQALIHDPELVFLDEPTDGVDPIGREAIRGIVEELSNTGTTIFINSHLLMEVEMICDQ
ncbi:MAG: ABC-2 type transport system ATP-binding protein, partial [Planctomycetota bacterium]